MCLILCFIMKLYWILIIASLLDLSKCITLEFNGMRDAVKDEFPYIISIQGLKIEEVFGGYLITESHHITSCTCGEAVQKAPLNEHNVYEGWAIVAGTNSLNPNIEDDTYQFRQIKFIDNFDAACSWKVKWYSGYVILRSDSRFILNNHISLTPLMNNTGEVRATNFFFSEYMSYRLTMLAEENRTCQSVIWDDDTDINIIDNPSQKLIYIHLFMDSVCKEKLCKQEERFCTIKNKIVCGGFHFGNKPCIEFSGAPIICEGIVLGINSWNTNCEKTPFYAVFTPYERTVTKMTWLQSITQKNRPSVIVIFYLLLCTIFKFHI